MVHHHGVTHTAVFALPASIVVGELVTVLFGSRIASDRFDTIEPFWPFFDEAWAVDVVWDNAWWINGGLLVAVILSHLALARVSTSSDRHYRFTSAK